MVSALSVGVWNCSRISVGFCVSSCFFSSRRRHTRCALVTGVQTCALPIFPFYKGVAAEYTVCDRYHSGILASTQANRMYVHCGQTDRSNNAGGLLGVIPATSTLPTVWDKAANAGVSARYYFNNLQYTAIWGAKYLGMSKPVAAFARQGVV